MFPEGVASFAFCRKCDELVVLAHVSGIKEKVDRISIPFKDALVLRKYWGAVFNIWPNWTTQYKQPGHPIKFFVTYWASVSRPARGRLYVQHRCGVKREAN